MAQERPIWPKDNPPSDPPGRPPRRLRVFIVDDHELVLQAVRALLERRGFKVVGVAPDGPEATRLVPLARPDVVVLDLVLPEGDGLAVAREMRRLSPGAGIVLFSGLMEPGIVPLALESGVRGFALKGQRLTELVEAVRAVAAGRLYVSPAFAPAFAEACARPDASVHVSPREEQVAALIAAGRSTKEVAAQLGLKVKTVEDIRSRIMKKLDVHETASLTRWAIRRGLIRA